MTGEFVAGFILAVFLGFIYFRIKRHQDKKTNYQGTNSPAPRTDKPPYGKE